MSSADSSPMMAFFNAVVMTSAATNGSRRLPHAGFWPILNLLKVVELVSVFFSSFFRACLWSKILARSKRKGN